MAISVNTSLNRTVHVNCKTRSMQHTLVSHPPVPFRSTLAFADHNRLVSTPTAAATLRAPPAAGAHKSSLSSATLKSSTPLVLGSSSTRAPPIATAPSAASRCPPQLTQHTHSASAIKSVPPSSVAVPLVVARTAAAIERDSVDVATQSCTSSRCTDASTTAALGCDGGDGCANGKGVEALGVLMQYLVFHVSTIR